MDLNPIIIGARYHYGLQDIMDEDFSNFFGKDVRNSVFQLYVALSF